MGNLCNATFLTKLLFKQQIKNEIIHLLYKVVDDETDCYVNNNRLMKLKNQMTVVRRMSNEWYIMINHCIASGCETRTTIKNILEIMHGAEESLKIGNILCLCTYVTDVCVMLLSRNDVADVCEIIDVLVEYMIEKNIVMCVKFLQYLDVV